MKRRLDLICSEGHIRKDVVFDSDQNPVCECGAQMDSYWEGVKSMVNGDDIPGGLDVRHGICHPDGTPKRYYSKSEIRKAAAEAGYTIHGETPKLPSHLADKRWAEAEKKGRRFI